MTRTALLAAALAAATAVAALIPAAYAIVKYPNPLGTWVDHKGRGAIEITDCGNGLCGKIVWLKEAADAEACGAPIIHQVADLGNGAWGKGYIYDIERNALYDLSLAPKDDTLEVTASIMNGWLSRTMVWKKAPADLKPCTPTRTFDVSQLPDGVEIN
jgi:uncharacterized protein (DUF2147 family)